MIKQHTTIKNIRNNYKKVFRCGYCDLQLIYRGVDPQFYNAGLYGWNCDIYVDYTRDIAITTGYRNMAGRMIPDELIKKYSKIAEEITSNYARPYEETRAKLQKKSLQTTQDLTKKPEKHLTKILKTF